MQGVLRAGAFAAALSGLPIIACAAEYYMTGMGSKSCGQMIQDYRENADIYRDLYATWLVGFMSGSNSVCSKQARSDYYGSEAYLRKYCDQNPLSHVATGAHKLRKELGGPATPEDCK